MRKKREKIIKRGFSSLPLVPRSFQYLGKEEGGKVNYYVLFLFPLYPVIGTLSEMLCKSL